MKEIIEKLKKLQDVKYRDFQAGLVPNIDISNVLGVRTPNLKKLAKEMIGSEKILPRETEKFLRELPHKYFDENQLHIFIVSEIKNYDECINEVEKFLPYIDNWATCDQLCPKIFKKNKKDLYKHIEKWINSKKAYTVRFGVKCLMQYFLDEDFNIEYLEMVENINFPQKKSRDNKNVVKGKESKEGMINIKNTYSVKDDPDKYYVEMMRAWFFATALAKQYKETLTILEKQKLPIWTHNKAIQKATESFRVSDNHKKEIKKLIINGQEKLK